MVGAQIDSIEDWLHGGNVADMGKKSGEGSGNSRRTVDDRIVSGSRNWNGKIGN